jgi:ADP-ribose pyrophosphatase YjhB (NUDIX family)
MKYCSDCGAPVSMRVPEGDLLPRFVCDRCGIVHYQNPKIVVGCVPEFEGRIVICKRAIEPRVGYWTVPAGFLENGETLQQGAAREAHEEALAKVEILSLLTIVHVIHAHQVHVFFRARLLGPEIGAGPESLDARLVTADELPWADIAFPSTDYTLRRFLEDRTAGVDRHHFTQFNRRAR